MASSYAREDVAFQCLVRVRTNVLVRGLIPRLFRCPPTCANGRAFGCPFACLGASDPVPLVYELL